MVCESILKIIKKSLIPFAAISTSSLLFHMNHVKAQTLGEWLWERGSIKNNPYNNNGGNISIIETMKEWKELIQKINNGIDWINHLPEKIPQMSVNLLSWIYELLSKYILVTPLWLFKNSYFTNVTLIFSILSVAVVTILTLIESIKRMYPSKRIQYTPFKEILKRFPMAIAASGFAPFAFEQIYGFLNKLSQSISSIGRGYIQKEHAVNFDWASLDFLTIVGLDIALISMLFPIFIKNGRRFFDIVALGAMTPLAFSAWVFDDYKHLHQKWWRHLKQMSIMQITYSIFICLIGILIFGTTNDFSPDGISSYFVKILVILGGLSRLINPPNIVLSSADHGKDIWSLGKDFIQTFTLKNFTPLKFYSTEIKPIINKYHKQKIDEENYRQELIKNNLNRKDD